MCLAASVRGPSFPSSASSLTVHSCFTNVCMSGLIKIKISAHLHEFFFFLKAIRIITENIKRMWGSVRAGLQAIKKRTGPNELIETWTGFILTFFM